ncbi:MAG: IclR family transcriptional regulator [Nocardioidaceae bacterium]
MSRPVPAATAALRVLQLLASRPAPEPASRIADALSMPRSSTYHLLSAMVAEGFVAHYPEERRWGLGVAAFEVGAGYARHQPLQRRARLPLAALVDRTGHSAHLAVLHGRDVLYVLEERAPGQPPLVTNVDVRLPATLTATGRAILASLSADQVSALFPDRSAFVDRHGTGPTSPTALRAILADTRRDGTATEVGEVTPGFASVAAVVPGHAAPTWTAVALTYRLGGTQSERTVAELRVAVRATAQEIATRLRGAR